MATVYVAVSLFKIKILLCRSTRVSITTRLYEKILKLLPLIHFFRQCNLLEALKESEKFRLFFKDPSLNGEFYALSKTPLFDCDRVKFDVFYRKILAVKNDVEKSWKDGLIRAQLMSEEQRLYDRFSEVSFLAWVTWI